MNKVCSKCGLEKPLGEFYPVAKLFKGRHCWCKLCCRARGRMDYEAHKETHRLKRQRYQKANPGYHKKYREANPEYQKEYQKKNALRIQNTSLSSHLKRTYGLSVTQYQQMVREQGGVCAVCKREDKRKMRLSVDHDHETGKIRGLLCGVCNAAIGMLDDSPEMCEAAAMYLRRISIKTVESTNK